MVKSIVINVLGNMINVDVKSIESVHGIKINDQYNSIVRTKSGKEYIALTPSYHEILEIWDDRDKTSCELCPYYKQYLKAKEILNNA